MTYIVLRNCHLLYVPCVYSLNLTEFSAIEYFENNEILITVIHDN